MGYIAEPKGVDFLIESPPLTKKEKKEISEFIKKLKEKDKKRQSRKKSSLRSKKKENA